MSLERILSERKSAIVKRWIDCIIDTYPSNTQRFLRKEKDPFSNPVGSTVKAEIEAMFDGLIHADDPGVSIALENIVRVRAVQDFEPSQAISFVFHLKRIIRDELREQIPRDGLSEDWERIEGKIDGLALLAFDTYSKCRRRIYELRVNEAKRQVSGLLRRANLISEIPDLDPDNTDKETDRVI